MKIIISAILFIFCTHSFSQSYFVLESGITLSVDVNGYVYDLGHYTPLSRMTAKGGQFLVEDTNILVTVDSQGVLYRKYEIMPKHFISKGMNYFINEIGSLFTIDQDGVVHLIEQNSEVQGARKFGGNFFITDKNEIIVIDPSGALINQIVEGVEVDDVLLVGGQYFMTNRGALYTLSRDGKIVSPTEERVGPVTKKGGNYFIDSFGHLYTISQDGILKLPSLPLTLKVSSISKLGSNYFIDTEGKLFTVDIDGHVWERWIDYDLKTVKVTSL